MAAKRQEVATAQIIENWKDSGKFTYASEQQIRETSAILLTKNYSDIPGRFYRGIIALSLEKKNDYRLYLCPTGGYSFFTENQIDDLMEEALVEIVEQDIKIIEIAKFVGRHPGKTIENFTKWQSREKAHGVATKSANRRK